MDFPQSVTETSEYKALKSYLSEEKSLDDTVQEFTSTTSSESAEDKLLHSWDALTYLASRTDASSPSQQKLVDFLTNLQSQTSEIGDLEGKQVSWKDLPLYGRQVREHWNYDEEIAQNDKEISGYWANANAFQARVTASASKFDGTDPLDFSLYAVWALRAALEDKDDVPAATVRTAAMWILYAGDVLRKQGKEKREFEGKSAKAGDKYPKKEWNGFSTDRWRTWENRFANIKDIGVEEEIRDVAKQAQRKMQDLAA